MIFRKLYWVGTQKTASTRLPLLLVVEVIRGTMIFRKLYWVGTQKTASTRLPLLLVVEVMRGTMIFRILYWVGTQKIASTRLPLVMVVEVMSGTMIFRKLYWVGTQKIVSARLPLLVVVEVMRGTMIFRKLYWVGTQKTASTRLPLLLVVEVIRGTMIFRKLYWVGTQKTASTRLPLLLVVEVIRGTMIFRKLYWPRFQPGGSNKMTASLAVRPKGSGAVTESLTIAMIAESTSINGTATGIRAGEVWASREVLSTSFSRTAKCNYRSRNVKPAQTDGGHLSADRRRHRTFEEWKNQNKTDPRPHLEVVLSGGLFFTLLDTGAAPLENCPTLRLADGRTPKVELVYSLDGRMPRTYKRDPRAKHHRPVDEEAIKRALDAVAKSYLLEKLKSSLKSQNQRCTDTQKKQEVDKS
ncbi:hypothetical protein J6590_072372 [Homalodisca vitripennis]|nr:hypothetical protein J6590_072372 [Homalodisca vitripennis]